MLPYRLCVIIAGILFSVTVQAGIYRWVDENGVTVYSQFPPPADVEKKKIDAPSPPPVTEEEAWKEVNQDWKKMQDRQDIIKEQAIADSERGQKEQDEQKNCDTAQRMIEQLENSRNKRMRTADGKTIRTSAEEREEQLLKAREMEEKYCD